MRLKFGPPTAGKSGGGWPVFDKDGKRVREEPPVKPPAKPRKPAAK